MLHAQNLLPFLPRSMTQQGLHDRRVDWFLKPLDEFSLLIWDWSVESAQVLKPSVAQNNTKRIEGQRVLDHLSKQYWLRALVFWCFLRSPHSEPNPQVPWQVNGLQDVGILERVQIFRLKVAHSSTPIIYHWLIWVWNPGGYDIWLNGASTWSILPVFLHHMSDHLLQKFNSQNLLRPFFGKISPPNIKHEDVFPVLKYSLLNSSSLRHPEKNATCTWSHGNSSCWHGIQVPDMVYCPYKYNPLYTPRYWNSLPSCTLPHKVSGPSRDNCTWSTTLPRGLLTMVIYHLPPGIGFCLDDQQLTRESKVDQPSLYLFWLLKLKHHVK